MTSGRRPSRRWIAVLAASVLIEALGGASVLYLRSRDGATPLTVGVAVSRFRGSAGATVTTVTAATMAPLGRGTRSGPAPSAGSPTEAATTTPTSGPNPAPVQRFPAPGVYVYDTAGGERLESFGGASHDYPDQTTITVSADGCGHRMRWDALEERWDETTLCPTESGDEVRTQTFSHEFFGRSERRDYQCEPGSLNRPASDVPGTTWSIRCAAEGTTSVGTTTLVELTPLEVAGTAVDTVHLRTVTTESGSTRGGTSWDYWLRTTDGLLVRRVASVEADSDMAVGTVHYVEDYELRLASLTPQV